jgi:hypothetical protein
MRKHLSYANVMATLAFLIAVAGGTAYAANTVFSEDIVNGEVKAPDLHTAAVTGPKIRDGEVSNIDLRADAVDGSKIQDNSISSTEVVANSLNGSDITDATIGVTDLTAGALGARAYGRVSALSALSRSKNIASVTNPMDGLFCIDPAFGIDPSTAVLLVDSDWSGDSTSGRAVHRDVPPERSR